MRCRCAPRPAAAFGTKHLAIHCPSKEAPMSGFTGPNNRRYVKPRHWLGLTVLGASLVGAVLGWLRLRKKP
jgi:hypothetical protein